MANIIIGTKATIGTVSSRPTRFFCQPHWKIATTTPYAAPIDSRFMIAAFSGTRIDRNTIMSSTNDRAMTVPMNSSRRDAMRSARSMNVAVDPPT
jgi:hypothetical protein